MKVILDTNVFISGVYFDGHPYRILQAWNNGRVSGDKHLLKVSGFRGIEVLKPREFVDRYLQA